MRSSVTCGFSLLSIQQSSFSQEASNFISVAFTPYVTIDSPAYILFEGFVGAYAPSGVIELLDTSPSSICVDDVTCNKLFDISIFGDGLSKAEWSDVNQSLALRSNRPITPQMTVRFTWKLTNGQLGQSSPTIFASGISGNCSLGITEFTSVGGNEQILLLADVSGSLVSQSTPLNSALNTLTVRLSFNFDLGYQDFSSLTLSGLGASSTHEGFILLSSPSNQSWPSTTTTAYYNRSASYLVMNISNIKSFTNYSFSFNLSNPSAGQLAPDIFLHLSGAATITRRLLSNDQGNAAPLFVYG
eukprot:758965-Hanusia_phi.AAC.4